MTNPLNPLNWLKSAQDWFVKTERSSGFRPYLIYMLLVFGLCLVLLIVFKEMEMIRYFCLLMLAVTSTSFIGLFAIKCFQDPEFCRSEKHIEAMKRIELEKMGTEQKQVDAEVINVEQIVYAPEKK